MGMRADILVIPVGTVVIASGDSTQLGGQAPNGLPYELGCPVASQDELAVDVTLVSINAGSATFTIDRKGLDGIWYMVASSGALTAPGVYTTTLAGQNSVSQSFGKTIRLRWVLAGGANNVVFSASIIGK